MSNNPIGFSLLHALRALFLLLLKICALVFAWCCKIIGTILIKLGEFTFKVVEK